MYTTFAIITGVIIDFIVGDPQGWFHPIRVIGNLITRAEGLLRSCFPKTEKGELLGGAALMLIVVSLSMAVPALLLLAAWRIHPWLYYAFASVMSYYLMATKSLKTESMKVYASLRKGDLEEARYHVSMLVGRDTDRLDEVGVTKAAVETVAENTSDGCIAPLFYLMIGGPVLGFFYKAVNTLDSMVGYKNEQYLYFGRVSARLDDVVNYIPARLAAYAMIAATKLLGMDTKQAVIIHRRDWKKSTSPNSAQTETVCAGALNIELLGDTYYFGKLYHKPVIGDNIRNAQMEDIRRANQLLYMTVFVTFVLFIWIRLGVLILIG